MDAKKEKNKKRTKNKASHQYPGDPLPNGDQRYTLLGVPLAALETYNVIRSAASCIATTPYLNRFSTRQALSNGYFHNNLSADVRLTVCVIPLRGTAGENKA